MSEHQIESKSYAAPTVTTLGTVDEMTLANNKVGVTADTFTAQTGLVGSIVPAP
jgi:hypothetical protein